jgi:hypothetical protein
VLAGADFFTVEVLKWRGLVTYYVLFFLHLETRRMVVLQVSKGNWGFAGKRSLTKIQAATSKSSLMNRF